MSISELQQLDMSIKHSQKMVDLGAALERLRSNRDFKKVVIEGYFAEEAARLVHLMADANMQSPDKQQSIQKQMIAVGGFRDYLNTLETLAGIARRSIQSDEAMRDEILAEEG